MPGILSFTTKWRTLSPRSSVMVFETKCPSCAPLSWRTTRSGEACKTATSVNAMRRICPSLIRAGSGLRRFPLRRRSRHDPSHAKYSSRKPVESFRMRALTSPFWTSTLSPGFSDTSTGSRARSDRGAATHNTRSVWGILTPSPFVGSGACSSQTSSSFLRSCNGCRPSIRTVESGRASADPSRTGPFPHRRV